MVAGIAALAVFILVSGAEWRHARRCRRVGYLAFGPTGRAREWTAVVPALRVITLTALAWALTTLLLLTPKEFQRQNMPLEQYRRLLIVLDVSPSMKLEDAGPEHKLKRSERASDVLKSIFNRITTDQVLVSVVAVYSDAKEVVIDTRDMAVIDNIMDDLPMEYAFAYGKTQLIMGVNKVAEIAKKWPPQSTTVLIVSDGDTLPDTGMAEMPESIAHTLVLGVGDIRRGIFIDGHHSRQDSATLRQLARRLDGEYFDVNEEHVPSQAIIALAQKLPMATTRTIGKREIALVLVFAAATMFALIPLALQLAGSYWHRERQQA
ncbi:MAG: VWA domain-containing protein [Sedimentisphaerales bacterium]|nr:VWA domain-containing protein [Sedimentisphaerales bacterium]